MISTKKSILVTGGAGFIGSHLTKRLLKDGYDVHILIKKSTNCFRLQDEFDQLHCHYIDLLDAVKLKEFVENLKPYGVFHLAASNIASGVTASDEDVLNTNILGFKNLVDSLNEIDYEFLINMGSFLEYGFKTKPVKEDELCAPTELFSISKLTATLYGQAMARKFNKPIITFRLFTPYGPAVQAGRLVYEVINRALKNTDVEVTNREVARDFIYVEDIVDLCIKAMFKAKDVGGQIFNLGSGKVILVGELVDTIVQKINSRSQILWGSKPLLAYDSNLWQADMSKTFQVFDWRPKYNLDEGLNNTIEYFKQI